MAVDVEYAWRGDISIAYQAIGNGPVDIIFGAGLVSHLDLMWGDPDATTFLRRLASIGRLLLFDKPGTGLSDPVVGLATLDQRVEDFLAVLDAAGSRRAIVIGFSEAATAATLLAATHPERVEALVFLSGFPKATADAEFLPELEDYTENVLWRALWHSAAHWGDGSLARTLSPRMRDSALYRRLAPSLERASASPGMAKALINSIRDYDVTGVLNAVRVPTLVVHRKEEFLPIQFAEWTAENITGARFLPLEGAEHMCFFEGDDIVDGIEQFIGGAPARGASNTRKLTTVLFTDIVASTESLAEGGDDRWRSVLSRHDELASEEVARHEGALVNTTGDGVFAAFDRPLLALRCALAIGRRAADLGVQIRAGAHTGECEVVADDLAGIAVHIGARIAALAGAGEVLTSSTTKEIVFGSGVEFEPRGEHELKGVPGMWTIYAVMQDRSEDQRPASQASAEEASRTPGPAADMKPLDRVVVGFANRTPALSRASVKLFGRIRSRAR